jgi:hypothetical protein
MSWEYTDEAFRSALDALHRLLVDLAGVRDSIDTNEPLHHEIDARLSEIDRSREELEALYQDATQELL